MDDLPKRYYFDWAATAPPDPPLSAVVPFGNPSSLHSEGRAAREALEEARSRCAEVLGVQAKNLYFTSGGTESNSIVLHSTLLRNSPGGMLVSAVEHPSVVENAAVLERLGKKPGLIPVENDGRVTEASLEKALGKNGLPRLAAIMAVNNETGAAMDIPALVRLLRSRQKNPVHVHCDMVQALGKIPVDIGGWDIDSAAISAHKLGGPRGAGLLYLRKNIPTLYAGGGQEGGIRPGTENVAGALALAASLERRCKAETVKAEFQAAALRWQELITALKSLERCTLIPQDRLPEDSRFSPWILQAAFRGIPGEVMVRALDDKGFAVSTGSACSSRSRERPVLAAMGVDEETAFQGIRFSQGWSTRAADIAELIRAVREILQVL